MNEEVFSENSAEAETQRLETPTQGWDAAEVYKLLGYESNGKRFEDDTKLTKKGLLTKSLLALSVLALLVTGKTKMVEDWFASSPPGVKQNIDRDKPWLTSEDYEKQFSFTKTDGAQAVLSDHMSIDGDKPLIFSSLIRGHGDVGLDAERYELLRNVIEIDPQTGEEREISLELTGHNTVDAVKLKTPLTIGDKTIEFAPDDLIIYSRISGSSSLDSDEQSDQLSTVRLHFWWKSKRWCVVPGADPWETAPGIQRTEQRLEDAGNLV